MPTAKILLSDWHENQTECHSHDNALMNLPIARISSQQYENS